MRVQEIIALFLQKVYNYNFDDYGLYGLRPELLSSEPNNFRLQLEFVRIVCSHEHYVSLNLPSINPTELLAGSGGGASSPTPSIRSIDSQSSFIAHSVVMENRAPHWADLTYEFRKKHFLVGLVLNQLSNALEQS